jgi:hypothetical protein
MKKNKRFISIRVTPEDYRKIQEKYRLSGCKSLSQYVRNSLLNKQPTAPLIDIILTAVNERLDQIERKAGDQDGINIVNDSGSFKT